MAKYEVEVVGYLDINRVRSLYHSHVIFNLLCGTGTGTLFATYKELGMRGGIHSRYAWVCQSSN